MKIRKILLITAAPLILLTAVGWVVPVEGPWADFAVSKFLTDRMGLPIRCEKTKIFQWSRISFIALIDRKALRLREALHASSIFSSLPIAEGLEGTLAVDRPLVGFSGNRSGGLVRILRCESDGLSLRGGLELKDKQLVKAHIYFSLSPSRLKKLPLTVRSRLSQVKGGWAAVHIVFYQEQLTLIGRHGPLFQINWQGYLG